MSLPPRMQAWLAGQGLDGRRLGFVDDLSDAELESWIGEAYGGEVAAVDVAALVASLRAVVGRAAAEGERRKRALGAVSCARFGQLLAESEKVRRVAAASAARSSGEAVAALAARPPPGRAARWPTSRGQRRAEEVGDRPREDHERAERRKWVERIGQALVRAGLPVVARTRASVDPAGTLHRCGRGMRAATLRKRCRDWERAEQYLRAAYGRSWPEGVSEFLEYLEARAAEPCGPSVLSSALFALRYMELAGEVAVPDRLSGDAAFGNLMKEYAISQEAAVRAGARGHRGEAYPVTLVVALELCVTDVGLPRFVRAFAWVKLLKLWGALRHDDLQWLAPAEVLLEDGQLHARMTRTKTTGPGKKRSVLELCVSGGAWVAVPEWLSVGHALWVSFGGTRDYFVPCATADLEGVRAVRAGYSDMVAYSRALFSRLRVPVAGLGEGGGVVWRLSDDALLHEGVAAYWTEHSERTGIISYAAAAGVPESDRRLLGRWALSVAEGYVRTTGGVVVKVQNVVAEAMRDAMTRDCDLGVSGLLRNLGVWMRGRGFADEVVSGQLLVLSSPGGPAPRAAEVGGPAPAGAPVPDGTDDEEFVEVPTGYVVCRSRGAAVRRLHWAGRCMQDPSARCRSLEVHGHVLPPPENYDFVCRRCWPGGAPAGEGDEAEVGTSSESSSTASSDGLWS